MTNNSLAFIALCNEYCAAVESCVTSDPREFTANMLRLLPRIYISATDLTAEDSAAGGYVEQALDEETYEAVRRNLSVVMGKDDTYLEVFENDMKFSDTPIGASVSENLADLFQVFYNMLETVRDSPDEIINEALSYVKDDFAEYWSMTLCNVLRALNSIYFNLNDNVE